MALVAVAVGCTINTSAPATHASASSCCADTAGADSAGGASEGTSEDGISWTTLGNGLQVIVVEDHAQPLVTIEVAVKNGAYTEPPEFDGLSHLYEHMFFKGNAAIPNQEQYMERLRELGARWNGTTSTERVNYFMTAHKKNLNAGMVFLRDALLFPLFKEDELRHEWPVVLGEFDRNEAAPSFHLRRAVDRRLWSENFSRKNTIGDREVIFNATREQMREIQRRYYIPNNSALLVGGDVNPGEVFDMAELLFGSWERGADPNIAWPIPAHPPLEGTSRVVVPAEVRTATLQIAWHGPSLVSDPEATYAADALSFILSQADSEFHKALVDTGLVDGVDLSYYSQVHTGPITLSASTSADRLDAAWEAINIELEKMADPDYVTDEQLEAAKTILENNEIYSREQTSGFVHSVSFWWATGGLDYFLSYLDSLRAVEREDLARYVQTYIQGKPRIEAALVSEADLGTIEFAKTADVVRPESGSSSAAFDRPAESGEVTTIEFDVDGLEVVLRRNPQSQITVARMVIQGGLPLYGADAAGRELVLLETLTKGSSSYSKEEINRRLARTGASISPSAGQDYSTLSLRTLRRDFDENFAIFADVIAHPLLDATEVGLVIDRRLSHIRIQEQTPDSYISVLASRNFYAGHPYSTPPSGSEESVTGLTAEQVREIHGKTMTRARLKLYVVGNVTEDELRVLVRDGLSDLATGEVAPKAPPRVAAEPRSLLIEERDLPTNYVFGCFDAPNFGAEDYAAFRVAAAILDDRLFREVRTRRNLSYAVASIISSRLANYGVLYVTTVKPNETLEVMLAEVEKIIADPVAEKELRDKVEEMITGDLVGNQTAASQVGRLVQYDMNGGGWAGEAEALEKILAVTPATIQAAAARYLKDFSFAVLGNAEGLDRELYTSR